MKVKLKFLALGLVTLMLAYCASAPDKPSDVVYQEAKYYENLSFDDIWTMSLKSSEDMNFTIKEKLFERGFFDAEDRSESSTVPPPLMSIVIIVEKGKIKVNCLVVIKEGLGDYETCYNYVVTFFEAMSYNLGKLR